MAKKNSTSSKTAAIFQGVALTTKKNVISFVESLPKYEMDESQFLEIMSRSFYFNGRFHGDNFTGRGNYSQFPRQMGLYYIDNGRYIPRFCSNLNETDAESYLKYWLKLYYLPNPTSTVKLIPNTSFDKPKYFLKSLIEFIENNPEIRNIYDIVDSLLCQPITRNDKGNLAKILNSFSDCIFVDLNNNVLLLPNYKETMAEIEELINNPKRFFEHFGTSETKAYPRNDKLLQQIYYGAPGTGKSNEIKELTGNGKNGIKFDKDCTFRTTFHPDSDYASFVGAYKPYWDKEKDNGNGKIVYGFRPQAFLKAYIKAWKNPDKSVALVVEEINRGNCAQIFGDIFQLLDREKNGLSKYPIECDVEMQEYLAHEFEKTTAFGVEITDTMYEDSKDNINEYYSSHFDDAFSKIKYGEILALPMNLSIIATMNTSDQSLFPMDSAFKRRWDWIYEPIVEGTDKGGNKLNWKIEAGKHKLNAEDEKECIVEWWKFLQKINAVIYSLTSSEDKQLGYFFCQPDMEDGVTISKNLFVGKVIFYLWNEIFKDYAFEHVVCKKENKGETLYFADFYKGKNIINDTSLETFFKHLDENQPKIDNKDVKLIEEKFVAVLTIDPPTDGANDADETPEELFPEQSEETATENTEA